MWQRRWEVVLFWTGISTAIVISLWRMLQVVSNLLNATAKQATALAHLDWIGNAFLFWALTLLIMAWLSWRESRRREAELETIISSVNPDVLLVVNPDRTIRICNPAVRELFGYEPAEVIGNKTDLLYSDRRDKEGGSDIRTALQDTGHHVGLAKGKHKDGTPIPLEIVTGKLIERTGAVVLIRDITERQRLEQLREDLIAMLVHDLKNPLTSISGCLAMVEAALNKGQTLDPTLVKWAQQSTAQLSNMVYSLLDTTKLERGEMRLSRSRVDLVTVVAESSAMFSSTLELKNVTLRLPGGTLPAYCDRDLVGRIISNLLGNAVKFTPEGGVIQIMLEQTDAGFKTSVIDTGRGIPAEHLDTIFRRFAQVEVHKYSYGLGLTFCKLAVEAHGGTIGVESVVGQGSTFWFTLPTFPPS
jgi:PAS domain S-box-containing protein